MTAVYADLDNIESNLKRAEKTLRVFGRQVATDKIALIFIFLLLAGVIFIIVWKLTHEDDLPADVFTSSVSDTMDIGKEAVAPAPA